jgi:hypothetical protein
VLVATAVGCERNSSLSTTESTGSDEPEGTPLIDLRDDLRRQRVSAADRDVPVWMAEIAASMNAIAMSPE